MDTKQTEALRIATESLPMLKIAASLGDETGQISFHSSHLLNLIEGYNAARQEIASLRAQLATVSVGGVGSLVSVPPECPHLIWYADQDRKPEMFVGHGARDTAMKRFHMISQHWNANLFVRIKKSSRDCPYPVADLAPAPAQPSKYGSPELHALIIARAMEKEASPATQEQASEYDGPELRAMVLAVAALSDIGDAHREPGDDLAWCEKRAAKDLPVIRAALQSMRGKHASLQSAQAQLAGRKPLTDEAIFDIAEPFGSFAHGDAQGDKRRDFVRAIEAAHGITLKQGDAA